MTNWELETPLTLTAPINIKKDPFSATGGYMNVLFSAGDLRSVFINKVWEHRLRPIIRIALQRGREELSGAPISVVLLSGGSANIGWLRQLLQRDFRSELSEAEILRLPDFQEVVAKGLAVECARRFGNQEGDFSSVTYNRLCLILDPDGSECKVRNFRPRTEGLPNVADIPGVVLPSASILQNFIEKPIRWKVKLERPPRRRLHYYFLRSSFDPNDFDNRQNVEEFTVFTPANCSFDAQIQVELIVKQDGTTKPRFIYKTGRNEEDTIAVNAKPFYLDMTFSQAKAAGSKAYTGLDFGTSNTSIAFVDESSIQIYHKRSGESSWNDLNELVSTLPYLLAAPLALYIQSDPSKLVKPAFEFLEASLAMAAFITYLDYCVNKGQSESKLFKGFTQRSAGPLWRLLQDCLKQLRNNNTISAPYKELLTPEFYKPIDDAVTTFAKYKHDKISEISLDTLRPVQVLANISQKVFANNIFGFFEQVHKQKFAVDFEGRFRPACGNPPFIKAMSYRGPLAFSEEEAFLLNLENHTALSLQPLIFWDRCDMHPDVDIGHCYIFDKPERVEGEFSFKAIGYPCSCPVLVKDQRYEALASKLMEYRERDPQISPLTVGTLCDISDV